MLSGFLESERAGGEGGGPMRDEREQMVRGLESSGIGRRGACLVRKEPESTKSYGKREDGGVIRWKAGVPGGPDETCCVPDGVVQAFQLMHEIPGGQGALEMSEILLEALAEEEEVVLVRKIRQPSQLCFHLLHLLHQKLFPSLAWSDQRA